MPININELTIKTRYLNTEAALQVTNAQEQLELMRNELNLQLRMGGIDQTQYDLFSRLSNATSLLALGVKNLIAKMDGGGGGL